MSKKTNKSAQTINVPLETLKERNTNIYLLIGVTSVLVFLAYAKIWNNGLVWDDDPYIILNEAVQNFDLKSILTGYHVGNYHPLTMLTLALEHLIVGDSPWLYHLNNLILHIANSILLFKIIKEFDLNDTIAWLCTIFFALHPMHVESVAWAAERKDVLYTFFLFWSYWLYIKYSKRPSVSLYFFSIALFVAACFSKGMAVVLPALLIITDWWMLGKGFNTKDLINKIPYFVITLIFAYIATNAQKEAGADASSVINAAYTGSERFRIVTYSFLFYWFKTIAPFNLLPFYPYPGKPNGSLPAEFNLSIFGIIIFLAVAFWLGRKNKKIWWAVSFFIIAISTVIQILPVGSAIVADRYYYLSSVGPLFLLAWFLGKNENGILPKVGYALAAFWLVLSFFQTGHWKNGYTLFKPAEKKYPEDAMVLSNIGWYHLAQKDFSTAKAYLMRSDNNGFKNADVCRTIGSMYIDEGDFNSALQYLEKAQLYLPKSHRTDWLTALAYLKLNQFEKALPFSEIAIKGNPESLDYKSTHAQILTGMGRYDEANNVYTDILKGNPEFWDSYLNIAYSHRLKGDKITEIKLLDELIKKAPSYLPAYRNIGVSLSELARHEEAVQYWQRAAVYDTTGDYEYNIGINFANRGRIDVAKDWYIKAAKKGKPEAVNLLKNNGVQY